MPTIVLVDNSGYGCIGSQQGECGGALFDNPLADTRHATLLAIDFVAHARSLGAEAPRVASLAELEAALAEGRSRPVTQLITIEFDAGPSTGAGGHRWEVAAPEVSVRREVGAARKCYEAQQRRQRVAKGRDTG